MSNEFGMSQSFKIQAINNRGKVSEKTLAVVNTEHAEARRAAVSFTRGPATCRRSLRLKLVSIAPSMSSWARQAYCVPRSIA